jgi:ATP synthase protein I
VKKDDKQQILNAFSMVGSIGLSMVATLAVGLFSGRAVDNLLGTYPWATIVGIVLGVLSGLWSTYKQVTQIGRDN